MRLRQEEGNRSADEAMLSSGVQLSADNKTILEENKNNEKITQKRNFSEVYKEVNTVLNSLRERITAGDTELSSTITSIIENYLGVGKKITEATPNQIDLVEAALAELKEL